jgi:hypothetical protein
LTISESVNDNKIVITQPIEVYLTTPQDIKDYNQAMKLLSLENKGLFIYLVDNLSTKGELKLYLARLGYSFINHGKIICIMLKERQVARVIWDNWQYVITPLHKELQQKTKEDLVDIAVRLGFSTSIGEKAVSITELRRIL